jgi:hypothetical protein
MSRKQEIIDNFKLEVGQVVTDAISLVSDLKDSGKRPVLKLNIDATHSGRLTNNRVYPGAVMRDSIDTFLKPTPRPVLKNHDDGSDPIGRVISAEFVQLKSGTAFENDFKRPTEGLGSGFVRLDLNIMDEDAIAKFVDGRFREFSTRQSFDSFLCSYCGNDFAKSFCGHFPGDTVIEEGKKGKPDREFKVFGITGPLKYREVSVVNIPGDAHTKINELELVSADSFNSPDGWLLTCDNHAGSVGNLVLTDTNGRSEVDLLALGKHTHVTAEDRRRLTGKTIVAVSPYFEEGENMSDVKTEDNTADETVDNTAAVKEEKNNVDGKTRSSDGEATKDKEPESSKEGVVAPEKQDGEGSGEANNEGLDADELRAGYKALVTQNKTLESDLTEKTSEIERLKGELGTKKDELETVQTSLADSASQLKELYAKQLLDTRLVLDKPDVSEVKDQESYQACLNKLCERSIDSLKDSLADLSVELIGYKKKAKITTAELAGPEKIENPVSNQPKDQNEGDKVMTRSEIISEVLDLE